MARFEGGADMNSMSSLANVFHNLIKQDGDRNSTNNSTITSSINPNTRSHLADQLYEMVTSMEISDLTNVVPILCTRGIDTVFADSR